jgi:hypothetical protein
MYFFNCFCAGILYTVGISSAPGPVPVEQQVQPENPVTERPTIDEPQQSTRVRAHHQLQPENPVMQQPTIDEPQQSTRVRAHHQLQPENPVIQRPPRDEPVQSIPVPARTERFRADPPPPRLPELSEELQTTIDSLLSQPPLTDQALRSLMETAGPIVLGKYFQPPRSPERAAQMLALSVSYFRVTEKSPGDIRAVMREIHLGTSGMNWSRLEWQMQNLMSREYVSKSDAMAIAELELDVIIYITLSRADLPQSVLSRPRGATKSSGYCMKLGAWKHAIQRYISGPVDRPAARFWKTIGAYYLRKECPIQFGHFWERQDYFRDLIRPPAERAATRLVIRRATALTDTFTLWSRHKELFTPQRQLTIVFFDETGVDAGGLLREWYTVLTTQLVNDGDLFESVEDAANTVRVLSQSQNSREGFHRFVGWFLARSIIDKQPIPVTFTSVFYKYLMNGVALTRLDRADCEAEHPEMFTHLKALLGMDPESEEFLAITRDMTFVFDTQSEDGVTTSHELIADGASTPVTTDNREQYLDAVCRFKLGRAVEAVMTPLVSGFQSMLPNVKLDDLFSPGEFRSMFTGTETVDVEDLIANSEFGGGFTRTSPAVQFLWDVLRSFSQEDLREFLTFVTGSSQVPLGGFKNLRGRDRRVTKFGVVRLYGNGDMNRWLPVSRTCFNRIDLPAYTSREILERKLRQAMELSRGSFSLS